MSAKGSLVITASLMVIGGNVTYVLWLQHFTPFHFLNYLPSYFKNYIFSICCVSPKFQAGNFLIQRDMS